MEEPEWGFCDLLDPVQLGIVYESFMKNANQDGMNAASAKPYLEAAEAIKEGIDNSFGWDFYVNGDEHNEPLQPFCRKLADYDNKMGWNPKEQ